MVALLWVLTRMTLLVMILSRMTLLVVVALLYDPDKFQFMITGWREYSYWYIKEMPLLPDEMKNIGCKVHLTVGFIY